MSESPVCWIGFDTSNYTTSAAACVMRTVTDGDGKAVPALVPEVIANCKAPLPVPAGGRGLRQSDAVFAHTRNLPGVIRELRGILEAGGWRVAAVGYSAKPRDAADSYMPCFLTGAVAAEAFAAGYGAPVYAFSHQNGHIMAALYSSARNGVSPGTDGIHTGIEPDAQPGSSAAMDPFSSVVPDSPFLAFHVSGGTTESVVAHPRRGGFDVEPVGWGADLHAGQVIDRVGVMMGLAFPCGRELEALAVTNTKKLPPIRPCVQDGVSHLSGVENQADRLWRDTQDAPLVAAFVLTFIGRTLRLMTDQIMAKQASVYGKLPVVYAGGVMSNHFIRPLLTAGASWDVRFSEPAFSADNAAGVSLLCAQMYLGKHGIESVNPPTVRGAD